MSFPTKEEAQARSERVAGLLSALRYLLEVVEQNSSGAVEKYFREIVPNRKFISGVPHLESLYQELLPKLAEHGEEFLLNLEWEVMEEPSFDEFYSLLAEEELEEGPEKRDFTDFLYAMSRKLPEPDGLNFFREYADSNDARLWYSENQVNLEEDVLEPSDFVIELHEKFRATFDTFPELNRQADAGVFEAHFKAPESLLVERDK